MKTSLATPLTGGRKKRPAWIQYLLAFFFASLILVGTWFKTNSEDSNIDDDFTEEPVGTWFSQFRNPQLKGLFCSSCQCTDDSCVYDPAAAKEKKDPPPTIPKIEAEFHFWNYIKDSEWMQDVCTGCCKAACLPHQCGKATDVYISLLGITPAKGAGKGCNSYAKEPIADPQNDESGTLCTAPADKDSVEQLEEMIQGIVAHFTSVNTAAFESGNNILWRISMNPNHVFLLEGYNGEFRLYQSWVSGFDLKYWVGPDKKICDSDAWAATAEGQGQRAVSKAVKAISDLNSAKSSFGKLQKFDLSEATELIKAMGSQLHARQVRVGEPRDFSKVIETKKWLGKEALSELQLRGLDKPFPIFTLAYQYWNAPIPSSPGTKRQSDS